VRVDLIAVERRRHQHEGRARHAAERDRADAGRRRRHRPGARHRAAGADRHEAAPWQVGALLGEPRGQRLDADLVLAREALQALDLEGDFQPVAADLGRFGRADEAPPRITRPRTVVLRPPVPPDIDLLFGEAVA